MSAKSLVKVTVMALLLGGAWVGSAIDRPVFVDKQGKALPIQEDADMVRFLRSARVTHWEEVGTGITHAKRLDLELDGVRARAIFHDIHKSETRLRRPTVGRVRGYRRDSYTNQIAAYELGRMLEIPNIPPTSPRHFNGLDGSAQLWIEQAMMEQERQEQGVNPPDWTLWNQLYADMRVFDNLINNIDRNTTNMLVDSQGNLWLIDHTRSFGKDKTIPTPETLTRCSNRLYDAIKNLDEKAVEDKMKQMKLLAPGEIKAIFHRRIELLATIDERIRRLGAEQVLFDYGDPEPGIKVGED